MIQDPSGNLYGTTSDGGKTGCFYPSGPCGVFFKLDATGKETVLHRFTGGNAGARPGGDLLRDDAGNLYGIADGGSGVCGEFGCGIIFKIDPNGNETTLYSFRQRLPTGSIRMAPWLWTAPATFTAQQSRGGITRTAIAAPKVVESSTNLISTPGKRRYSTGSRAKRTVTYRRRGSFVTPAGNLYGTTYEGGSFDAVIEGVRRRLRSER